MVHSRRRILQAAAAATISISYIGTRSYARSPDTNSRLQQGMIGCGGKGRDDALLTAQYGDFVAVCDASRRRAETYARHPALNGDGQPKLVIDNDHQQLLARDDIDAVICATPDRWHTPIYVDAIRASKHVYAEKPMTLTVDGIA